jgi:hypothetical protein
MKKIIFAVFAITTIVSCSTAPESKVTTEKVNSSQFGFNYDSSANIDAIKATNKDMENLDTTSYKAKYADSVVFYDNGNPMLLKDNLAFFSTWKSKNIQVKITKVNAIWGSKFNFKDGSSGDYVYQYIEVDFTQGTKKAHTHFFQADQFKDGKIIKEWNFYDPTTMSNLMK